MTIIIQNLKSVLANTCIHIQKKPITTVQDYFDAIDSSDAKRCIVTERILTLDELQKIVKDKMAGVDAPGIDGDIQNLDDFLKALDFSEE